MPIVRVRKGPCICLIHKEDLHSTILDFVIWWILKRSRIPEQKPRNNSIELGSCEESIPFPEWSVPGASLVVNENGVLDDMIGLDSANHYMPQFIYMGGGIMIAFAFVLMC
jgi:hypothetical protein